MGTSFHRISTKEEKRPHRLRTYVTYKSKDNDIYKQYMTEFRKQYGADTIYDVTYKAARDIIYPSHEKQVEEFIKLYRDKKLRVVHDMAAEAASRAADNYDDATKPAAYSYFYKCFKTEYEQFDQNGSLSTAGYQEFIRTYSNTPYNQMIYQKRLKKQGYNAIIDDNDALYNPGLKPAPDAPLIIFDPQRNLTVVGSKVVTLEDYEEAKKRNIERTDTGGVSHE